MAGKPWPDEEPLTLPPGVEHGTATAYNIHRCHCGPCRDWRRGVEQRKRQRRDGDLPPWSPPGRTHGTISCYNAGCHCADCRAAAARARRVRPSRMRTDLPHACSFCPSTYATERGLRTHVGKIHDSGVA